MFVGGMYHQKIIKTIIKEPHYEIDYGTVCDTDMTIQLQKLRDSCYYEDGKILLFHHKIVINDKITYTINKNEDRTDMVVLFCEDENLKKIIVYLRFKVGGGLSVTEASDDNPLIIKLKAYSIREIK